MEEAEKILQGNQLAMAVHEHVLREGHDISRFVEAKQIIQALDGKHTKRPMCNAVVFYIRVMFPRWLESGVQAAEIATRMRQLAEPVSMLPKLVPRLNGSTHRSMGFDSAQFAVWSYAHGLNPHVLTFTRDIVFFPNGSAALDAWALSYFLGQILCLPGRERMLLLGTPSLEATRNIYNNDSTVMKMSNFQCGLAVLNRR